MREYFISIAVLFSPQLISLRFSIFLSSIEFLASLSVQMSLSFLSNIKLTILFIAKIQTTIVSEVDSFVYCKTTMMSEVDSIVYCKTTVMSESILLFIILRIFY